MRTLHELPPFKDRWSYLYLEYGTLDQSAQGLVFAMEERRYRGEGGLNNQIWFLYEARVKFSSAESDRHRKRSESFFYAMLAAQVGATISSLALARKKKSALWALAGASGIVAVTIGAYVYLTI